MTFIAPPCLTKCSSGLSFCPRTSQNKVESGAIRAAFSRSSTGPAAANSRREASSSARSCFIINKIYITILHLSQPHCLGGLFMRVRELKTCDLHGRELHVPRWWNMIEGNFKVRGFAWRQKGRGTEKDRARFAQRNLLHVILKFDSGFDSRYNAITGIQDIACEIGHFFVNEAFRAAHFKISEFQPWRISLFLGAERKPRFGERWGRRRTAKEQQIQCRQAEQCRDRNDRRMPENSARLFLRLRQW